MKQILVLFLFIVIGLVTTLLEYRILGAISFIIAGIIFIKFLAQAEKDGEEIEIEQRLELFKKKNYLESKKIGGNLSPEEEDELIQTKIRLWELGSLNKN